jgi:phosphate-selective porin OprO and OprP
VPLRSKVARAGALALRGGTLAAVLLAASIAVAPDDASAQTTAQPQPQTKKPPPPRVRFRWQDHPRLDIGPLRIDFRARVTSDVRKSEAPFDEDELDNTVDLARRRVGIEGRFGNYVDFQVEREIGDAEDPWRDVFLNYRQFDFAQLQYGKFKLPFSLDENTSSTNLDFAYRSLIAVHLAPGRDIGVMVHGRVAREILQYEFGSFEQDGDNARTRNLTRVTGGRTTAWRLSATPGRNLESPYADVYVAVAGTSSEVPEGFPALQGDAVLGARMFEADFWVKGPRKRTGLEFRWRPGPASVKFETIRLTNERQDQSVEEEDLSPYEAKGWYFSGTYALTGESKADGLDNPRRPFLQGGIGAVELAARIERITFGTTSTDGDASTSPRADVYLGNSNRVVTFGVNWYLNRWVKVQFNFIRETMTDPAQGPLPTQPAFSSRVFRFQFQI